MTKAFGEPEAAEIAPGEGRRYGRLSALLRAQIETGELPIGSRLATERDLSLIHGVSRATVREALRKLELLGMIRRVQGAGTTVISDVPRRQVDATYSFDQLFLYPEGTVLEILEVLPATEDELRDLEALDTDGDGWLCARMVRRYDDGEVLFYTRAYLPNEFQPLFSHPDLARVPFYKIMSDSLGISMTDARVEIQPTLLTPDVQLPLLGHVSQEAVAGLCLTRSYFDAQKRLRQRSVSWHAHGRGGIRADVSLVDRR